MSSLSVNVDVDFRSVIGKLNKFRNRLDSVSEHKEEIYRDIIYPIIQEGMPHDTGAFAASPEADFYDMPFDKKRYAHGGITDDGIIIDPYQLTSDFTEHHYGKYAYYQSDWSPGWAIKANMDTITSEIKDLLLREE